MMVVMMVVVRVGVDRCYRSLSFVLLIFQRYGWRKRHAFSPKGSYVQQRDIRARVLRMFSRFVSKCLTMPSSLVLQGAHAILASRLRRRPGTPLR